MNRIVTSSVVRARRIRIAFGVGVIVAIVAASPNGVVAADGCRSTTDAVTHTVSDAPPAAESKESVLRLRLVASDDGRLKELVFRGASFGNDERVFDRLRDALERIAAPGTPEMKRLIVEIDADHELRHEYVIRALSAVTGRLDPMTGEMVRYVEKIKFAPQRPRKAADN